MEAESGFIIGAMAVAGVALVEFTYRRSHARRRKETLKALEYFESGAGKDINVDIQEIAHKWTLLRLASRDPQKYKLTEYTDRINTQIKALDPHKEKLTHQMSIGAGVNLGAIVDTEI